MLLPLKPTDLTTNTQACAASIQVYAKPKDEQINNIPYQKVAPIDLQVTRTYDHMVFLQSNGTQQSLRTVFLQAKY